MPVEEFLIDGKPASELRVVDLKELLEKRGLSKSGSKQVLIGRLKESMLSEEKDESLSNIVENSMPENEGRVPNMEFHNLQMKSCGSNIVAQYLEKQQQALLAAKKAAMQTRATDARHSSNSSSHEESSIVSSVNNGSEKVDTQPSFSPMKKSEKLVEDEKKSGGVMEEQQKTEYIDEDKSEVDKTILQEAIIVEEKDSPNTPQIPENATLKTTDEEMNEHKNHELEESGVVSILEKEEPLMSKEDIDQESQENSEAISNPSLLESKEIVEREDHNADVATSDSDRAGEVESGSERSIEEQMEEQSSDHGDAVPDAVTSSKDMECNDLPESVSTTEKPARKRRWGSTTVGKRATVSISSDSLKDIVGDVKTAEVAMLETQVEEQEEQLDYDDEPIPKRIVLPREEGEKEDVATQATEKAAATTTRTANDDSSAAIQRARKIKMDEPEVTECIRVRPASPARRPIDRIIHVHGLTRPFNYKSWLSFLSSFGKFDVQNDFWIDNIKSHCLVR
uniref:SAP domain-containing protein n=1 Tax=Romanomermis culicivorax TaxID=13658 RepID=A0A915IUX7_ROMCU